MELPESLMRKKKRAASVQLNTIHKQNVSYIQLQYQPKSKKRFLVCHIINILLTKLVLYSHVHVVISLYGRILTLVMCTDLAVFFLFPHDLCQDSSIMQTSCLVNKSCRDFTLVCNCCSHMQKNSERTTCTLPRLYSRQFSIELTLL